MNCRTMKLLEVPVKCELWHRDRLVAALDPHDI